MPLISVIIPAYNAAGQLHLSVGSVLKQDMGDFELIIINDGSKDNTADMARSMAENDSRIVVYNVENGGPASARNRGIEYAKGQYIMFLDADDTLEPDALSQAASAIGDSPILLTGYYIINSNDTQKIPYFFDSARLMKDELGESFVPLYVSNLLNQCWAKLYLTSFLRDNRIIFEDYRFGEDRLFILECLRAASSVSIGSACIYNYYVNNGTSLVSRFYDKKFDVCCLLADRAESLTRELGVWNDNAQRDLAYMYIKSVASCLTTTFSDSFTGGSTARKEYFRSILGCEQVRDAARIRFEKGFFAEALRTVFKTGSVPLNILAIRLMVLANKLSPRAFIKIKHRNH
ncbi:MAG: glycosyltransferase family 2 protein [Oscillospiraceae bacterium]|nr:glycosyltransferase family 2 protein [Oscillospiraceae bacterium]